MNINNLATGRSGVRTIVRPGFVAETGMSATAQLLKLSAVYVPVLLFGKSTELAGVVVAEQGRRHLGCAITAEGFLSVAITAC